MKLSQLKLLPMAAAMVLMGAAGSATAGAYALSSDNIQGFTINPAGAVSFSSSADTSGASAQLNGNIAGGPGVLGLSDAPIAIAPFSNFAGGIAPTNNSFTAVGLTTANYSYADALISHITTNSFNARTIAESHLATAGNASGTSTNSSASQFTATFSLATPAALNFTFQADPLIRTFIHDVGSTAQGTLSASLTIICNRQSGCSTPATAVNFGDTVFAWAPNGLVTGTTGVTGLIGGTETLDAENLQASVTNFGPANVFLDFSSGLGLQGYAAGTNSLGSGDYILTLAMTSTDAVFKAVPEPGTTALLGLGLAGLAFASRRRNKV